MNIEELMDVFTDEYDGDEKFVIKADLLYDLLRCYFEMHFCKYLDKLEKLE